MVPWAAKVAVAVLSAALTAALLLWALRFLRYREQAKLAHARWLTHEPPGSVYAGGAELGVRWPILAPAMLSPIPEERIESGRVRAALSAGCCSWRRRMCSCCCS